MIVGVQLVHPLSHEEFLTLTALEWPMIVFEVLVQGPYTTTVCVAFDTLKCVFFLMFQFWFCCWLHSFTIFS